ncbi:DUF6630 family protein [Comamonas sp. J-3]|uniref:DUF6630 family protein n=1 Tax=Comamonas trifloxystrobinivorans TaxID=3350256 RepID=UPI00372A5963
MGLSNWIKQALGKPADAQAAAPEQASVAKPAPLPAQGAVTIEDWRALSIVVAQALVPDDVDGLWTEVQLALTEPALYHSRFTDDLENRGIYGAEGVRPWLALVDGLQRRGQNCEFDWKLDMDDLVWNLKQLKSMQQAAVPLDVLAASEADGFDALQEAGSFLQTQGLALLSFDIDSDSYPLSVVDNSAVEPLLGLAQRLGQRLHWLHK